MPEPKKEAPAQDAQSAYEQQVNMVRRGKEIVVCGRKVASVAALNEALDHAEEYEGQVAAIKAGKQIHLGGRSAMTLDQLHFALNAKAAPPVKFVPSGVPMILGLGEQVDAAALQAQINEQSALILGLQGDKQSLETAKDALASELLLTKDHFATEIARADAAESSVRALTTERDAQAETIAELKKTIEELERVAAAAKTPETPISSPEPTATPEGAPAGEQVKE